MLYECILNDNFYGNLTGAMMAHKENSEAPEMKECYDKVMPPAFEHLVRELPKDKKFIAGDKMTIHDYTVGHWLTDCFRNPNGFHRAMSVAYEKENMPPRVVKYLDDIEAEMKEYFDKRHADLPRGG